MAKKSEPARSLRPRSITRGGGEGISSPTATSTPANRSPGRARPSDRSPARATRTHSPARGKLETSPISRRAGNSPSRTTPRQSKTSSSGGRSPARPPTPTRQSARHAEKSHLTARISPVSSAQPRYVSGAAELPPTPTEMDFRTDKKLQKIVDEYLSEATSGGGKKKQAKGGESRTSGALNAGKKCLSVVCSVTDGFVSLALLLVSIFGALFLTLACNLKSCSLTSLPAVPLTVKSYFDVEAAAAVTAWLAAAAIMSALPLGRSITLINHSGLKHSYKCNGLASLILVGGLLTAAYVYNVPVYAFISDRLLQIVTTLYIYAILLSVCMYVRSRKAKPQALSPFAQSGGFIKRFLLGRETNPTFFGIIDIKSLIFIHVTYISWIALEAVIFMESFQRGRLDYGVLIVAVCQALYTLDLIVFEVGLSTTMLMTTEGVGLGLIIQCLVFGPLIQTTVLRYLMLQPTPLISHWSSPAVASTGIIFLVGYVIYRGSSYQKHSYRKMPHHPGFLGLELIPSPTGKSLLCGGSWWSLCRHPNHLGIIIMVLAIVIPCGITSPVTYMYSVLTILGVIMRERKMEALCENKHGKAWHHYTQSVRSKLIPYLY